MASLDSKSCSICTNDYNATNHKSVILSCSHEFCLICLVRLKAAHSTDCPHCRQTFADFELPVLPKLVEDIHFDVSFDDTVSQNLCSPKKKAIIGCEAHEKPFVYWCNPMKEFYCMKCIVSLNVMASSLELIDDCVPLIQADITSCAIAADEVITSDWEKHKALREEATQQLEKIKNFREAMQQLEREFGEFIQDIDCHNANRREQSDLVKKIREMIPEMKSDRDMEMILKSKKSLRDLQASTQMPCKALPVTLLSKIACYYAEADRKEDAFIKKFSLVTTRSNNFKPQEAARKEHALTQKVFLQFGAIPPAPSHHHYQQYVTNHQQRNMFMPPNAFQQQISRPPYQPQLPQQPLPKREKKLIQIQNPVTLHTVDFTKFRETPPAGPSEEGSASNTPHPEAARKEHALTKEVFLGGQDEARANDVTWSRNGLGGKKAHRSKPVTPISRATSLRSAKADIYYQQHQAYYEDSDDGGY